MTPRDRIVVIVVLVVGAIAGSWVELIAPKRTEAASLGTQVATAQSQLDSARAQLAQSESARSRFAASYTQLVRLGEAVPPDDEVPSLIYQIQSAAHATRVDFRGLQVVPGAAATAAPVPTPGAAGAHPAGAGAAGASTPGASTAGAGAAGAGTAGALPPGVAVGPAGFPAEQFTFSFQGNFFRLSDFFNRLQHFVTSNHNVVSIRGRLMTLNAINLAPGPNGSPQISATVSATAYMLPASQGLVAGASPTGPASGTTAPAAPTASPSTPTAPAAITLR